MGQKGGKSVPEEGWTTATVGSASSPPNLSTRRRVRRSISNRGKTVGGNIGDGVEDALL